MVKEHVALFLLGALLATSQASAGPRNEPALADAEAMAGETTDLSVWMQRLQGRFVFEGVISHHESGDSGVICRQEEGCQGGDWKVSVTEGKADCTGFADSPGIQCVIYVEWEPRTFDDPAFVESTRDAAAQVLKRGMSDDGVGSFSNLRPAMILAGLMPSSPGAIRFLLVDDDGTAHPGALTLRGNTARAKPPCVNLPGKLACEQLFTLEARPEAQVLFLTYSIRTEFLRPRKSTPLESRAQRTIERVFEEFGVSFVLRRQAPGTEGAENPPADARQ